MRVERGGEERRREREEGVFECGGEERKIGRRMDVERGRGRASRYGVY
jgi:hypothetical protein